MEHEDAQQHGANSSDACPYGVGGADGDGLRCFGQKTHAHNGEEQESAHPQPPFGADNIFGLPQTEGETRLAASSDNQYYPVHGLLVFVHPDKIITNGGGNIHSKV